MADSNNYVRMSSNAEVRLCNILIRSIKSCCDFPDKHDRLHKGNRLHVTTNVVTEGGLTLKTASKHTVFRVQYLCLSLLLL